MMDMAKALEEAKKLHKNLLVKIVEAERICEKVDPLLPKGWHSEFSAKSGQLEFNKKEKAHAIEFRVVCGLVEKAIGGGLHRGVGNLGNTYLYGWAWHWFGDGRVALDVRVELNKPEGCKVTYETVSEKKPVVDEACLGIRKEASQQEG